MLEVGVWDYAAGRIDVNPIFWQIICLPSSGWVCPRYIRQSLSRTGESKNLCWW